MKKYFVLIAVASAFALGGCQAPGQRGGVSTAEFNCIAGTVGGAIVGGLIGSTIGGGTGKTLATAAGIGAGGYLGNTYSGCR